MPSPASGQNLSFGPQPTAAAPSAIARPRTTVSADPRRKRGCTPSRLGEGATVSSVRATPVLFGRRDTHTPMPTNLTATVPAPSAPPGAWLGIVRAVRSAVLLDLETVVLVTVGVWVLGGLV